MPPSFAHQCHLACVQSKGHALLLTGILLWPSARLINDMHVCIVYINPLCAESLGFSAFHVID